MIERTYFEKQLRHWKRENISIATEARQRSYFRDRREILATKRGRAERRRQRVIQETKERQNDR